MRRIAPVRKLKLVTGLAAGLLLGGGIIVSAATNSPPAGASPEFFDRLVNQARVSAQGDYQPPAASLPEALKNLSYDQYMDIRFRPEQALWHGTPGRFEMEFFHPGFLYRQPVRMHALEAGRERVIPFSPAMFDYGNHPLDPPLPADLFLTGLRVLYPVNQPAKLDEVAVFLGTCYFRMLGAHQTFGGSLRGLAINTAEPDGEEFPSFTEFWIEQPGQLANQIRLFARLESPHVAGAYEFLLQPGEPTTMEIEAHLFFRAEVKKLGLAPLTSMFFFGENRTRYHADYRPEVHDSDGLLVETSSHDWEWRPLVNPPKIFQITSFTNVAGYGLLQRDRNFDHYQDLEGHYESRPSYWIEPEGDWGKGQVELVEIPSTAERNDNIVAYWVPEQPVKQGQELHFRYRVRAFLTDDRLPAAKLLRVGQTRVQPGKDRTRFVIDFAGGTLPNGASPAPVGKVEVSSGKVENLVTQPNEMLNGWRIFFDLLPDGSQPSELRAVLQQNGKAIGETWLYRYVQP